MLFRIKRWIREQLTCGLLDDLSIDQLRSLADKFGYELRPKRKWTDPYENHPPTTERTFQVKEGAFGGSNKIHDFEKEDKAAIKKLLKNVNK